MPDPKPTEEVPPQAEDPPAAELASPEPASPEPDASDDHRTSGRSRLLEALRRPRRGQLLAAVLLAVVGFAAVTQVRTNVDDSTYAGAREQDLIDILSGLAGTSQRAEAQLQTLEQTKAQLESSTSKRQAALDQAQQQADTLSVLAGLVPVTGPGIEITITEDTGEVKVDSFLDLVEELRTNGAEALDVNGKVRLVAQSSIEQGVGGLEIDGTLVHSPFVVKAIGEPATLKGAVTFLRGPADELKGDGATVKVVELQSLDILSTHKNQ